ncbi:MAG: hypothetical protein IJF03_09925 [Lachnospiraceae bacterium]|nr:hypothetical protein [Lachnospiraceae bacterium]
MKYRITCTDVLNTAPVGCVMELGEKGTEFVVVAGRVIKATSRLKRRRK